jgi:hypothetical protein
MAFEAVTVMTIKITVFLNVLYYITLHGSKVSQMTAGCGISHTITKTHIQYN